MVPITIKNGDHHMTILDRRQIMLAAMGAAALPLLPRGALAQARTSLALVSAGPGSAFLGYGQAIAKVVAAGAPIDLEVRETKGSNENAELVSAGTVPLALLNMGPGFDAWNGKGPFAGKELRGMRAVAPMYETPFHTLTLKKSGIANLRQLAGKKVGVGPAKGPGEVFFDGIAAALGIQYTKVNGNPDALGKQVETGEIDAFWYGSGLPSPPFAAAASATDAVVIGFQPDEAEAFRKTFAYFAPYTIAANTYKGQTAPIQSLAVWNFIVAHKDVPADQVHAITAALLNNPAATKAAYPAAAATVKENVGANTFMPFHPGAARYYREAGVAIAPALLP